MFRLLIFLMSIFLLTVFQKYWYLIVSWILGCGIELLYHYRSLSILKISKIVWIYVGIGIAVICSVLRFDNHLENKNKELSSFVFSGMVTNQTKSDQYEIKFNNQKRLLSTKQNLEIGKLYGVSSAVNQVSQQPHFDRRSQIGKFEYSYRLWMKGYQGILKASRIWEENQSRQSYFLDFKSITNTALIGHFGRTDTAGLLQGMLIWGKSLLSEEAYNQFKSSGLVHLIVVSGGNIMMVSVLMGFLLFWLPYYIRIGVIAISIVWYWSICGRDSSVVRAVIMWIIGILGIYGGRLMDSLWVLKRTAILMLLINPYFLVYDLGFSLSFAAVLGLILSSKARGKYKEKHPMKASSKMYTIWMKIFTDYILPWIGATLGVLPVLILIWGTYNLTSFPSNLLVQLIAPLATIVWGISLLFPVSSLISSVLVWIAYFLLSFILKISAWTSEYGIIVEAHSFGVWIIMGACALLLIVLYLYSIDFFEQDENIL